MTGTKSTSGEWSQRGITLPELLVTLAVLGIVAGVIVTNLESMQSPLETGGDLLAGTMMQARARSIGTTAAHRVVPSGNGTLLVETAPSCKDTSWTADPGMQLDLPPGVELLETSWSVCFNSRGLASDNVVLTLQHPEAGQRQLEVLRGGIMRWL